jgi:hypothetical protein
VKLAGSRHHRAMVGSYYLPFVGQASYERAMRLADQAACSQFTDAGGPFRPQDGAAGRCRAGRACDAARRWPPARRTSGWARQSQMVNPFAQDPA